MSAIQVGTRDATPPADVKLPAEAGCVVRRLNWADDVVAVQYLASDGRREDSTVLEDNRPDVVADAPLALDLLFGALGVEHKCGNVEHDLVALPPPIERVDPRRLVVGSG